MKVDARLAGKLATPERKMLALLDQKAESADGKKVVDANGNELKKNLRIQGFNRARTSAAGPIRYVVADTIETRRKNCELQSESS